MLGFLAASSFTTTLTPVYYLLAMAALIFGGLWTLKMYNDRQKQDLVNRSLKEQSLADRLESNTKAAEKNTLSLERLSQKFDAFASSVVSKQTVTDFRLDKLEGHDNNRKSLRT